MSKTCKQPVVRTWVIGENLKAKYDSSEGVTFLNKEDMEVDIRGLSKSATNKLFQRLKGVRRD